jgi:hypothetical protein
MMEKTDWIVIGYSYGIIAMMIAVFLFGLRII